MYRDDAVGLKFMYARGGVGKHAQHGTVTWDWSFSFWCVRFITIHPLHHFKSLDIFRQFFFRFYIVGRCAAWRRTDRYNWLH